VFQKSFKNFESIRTNQVTYACNKLLIEILFCKMRLSNENFSVTIVKPTSFLEKLSGIRYFKYPVVKLDTIRRVLPIAI